MYPANYGLTGSELRYILEVQSGARALIVDKALAGRVDSVRDLPEIHFIGDSKAAAISTCSTPH